MRRLAMLLILALPLLPARAEALTLKEIVELHKAGLGDDVLVALIEVNKSIYTLDAGLLKDLKADGLSDRVLIAIINSGRAAQPQPLPASEPPPASSAAAAAPTVVVVDHHHEPAPAPQVIVQQVPVYVPVPVTAPRQRHVRVEASPGSPGSPYYVGQVPRQEAPRPPEPVYWGFGGKLRPDAWQPAGKPDSKEPGNKDPGRK